jgi:hypothetical protein
MLRETSIGGHWTPRFGFGYILVNRSHRVVCNARIIIIAVGRLRDKENM